MSVPVASRDTVSELVGYVRRQGYVRGDRLPSIRQLSDVLGIGRNAVRDGVLQAQTIGLVQIQPRLGVFVQNPDAGSDAPAPALAPEVSREVHNVFHILEARLVLELDLVAKAARAGHSEELLPLREALDAVVGHVQAVTGSREDRMAFVEADEAFHLGIAKLAGNSVMLGFLRSLLELLRPAKMDLLISSADLHRTDEQHIELYRSLLEGQPEFAQTVMREHLSKGRTMLLEHLRTLPATDMTKPKPV